MLAVTGGTGFVGAAIVRALADAGLGPIRVVSRDAARARERLSGLPVEAVSADVLAPDSHALIAAFEGCETVINAVQFPGYPVEVPRKGLTFERYDRQGTEHQVAAAQTAGVARFVYVSGVGADPESAKPWFRAKGLAERAVRESGLDWCCLRPSWLYGPEDNALNRFVAIARWSPVLPVVGDGRQQLQPVLVDDAARIAAAAADGALTGSVAEVGGPEVLDMDTVLRTMLAVLGKRRPLVHVPAVLPRLAGLAASALPRPPLSPGAVEFLVQDALADLTVLRAALEPPLTPLREGLERYLP